MIIIDVMLKIIDMFTPSFLLNNIDLVGQIMAVMILVMFDELVTGRIILPAVDNLRDFIFKKGKEELQVKYEWVPKYFARFLATLLFIFYFFMGYWILSEYVIVPILLRLKSILLIIVMIFFVLVSRALNNKRIRKRYLY